MPQSLQPTRRQAARFRKIAGAGPLQDVVDLGLERTAVGLRGGLELLQNVIVKVTNQYVRHAQNASNYFDGIIMILMVSSRQRFRKTMTVLLRGTPEAHQHNHEHIEAGPECTSIRTRSQRHAGFVCFG
jgi:hypothetical protein